MYFLIKFASGSYSVVDSALCLFFFAKNLFKALFRNEGGPTVYVVFFLKNMSSQNDRHKICDYDIKTLKYLKL